MLLVLLLLFASFVSFRWTFLVLPLFQLITSSFGEAQRKNKNKNRNVTEIKFIAMAQVISLMAYQIHTHTLHVIKLFSYYIQAKATLIDCDVCNETVNLWKTVCKHENGRKSYYPVHTLLHMCGLLDKHDMYSGLLREGIAFLIADQCYAAKNYVWQYSCNFNI